MSLNGKSRVIEIAVIAVGCCLYALGISAFTEPNAIAPGGATGIAVVINNFFDAIPVGTIIIILNIPLIIAGFKNFKFSFVLKTAAAIAVSSTLIDIFDWLLPKYKGDMIIAALAGGVLAGVGIALIMLKGATTGGTDIVAKLINKKWRYISVGRVMLYVDIIIVAIAALIFKSFETALYSALYLFTMSLVTDKLIYGADHGKMIFIITQNAENMAKEILRDAGRGMTRINVIGGYTQTDRTMLMCAVRPPEVARVLNAVKQNDDRAFVIITDVGEIIGEGFRKSE